MHVHISWLTAIVALLSWMVTVGAVNLFFNLRPNAPGAHAWSLISHS